MHCVCFSLIFFSFTAAPTDFKSLFIMSCCKLCMVCVQVPVQFSSVHGGIYALGKAHMHSTPSQKFLQRRL